MSVQQVIPITTICLTVLCLASPAKAQNLYTRTDVREAIERVERHGDEFKSAFKNATKNTVVSDREKRVRDSVEDLEDEVDNLQNNYKHGHYSEARANLDTAMLLASPINRFMLRNYFSPEALRAWNNLKDDLNVIALGYGVPPLPNLVTASFGPAPATAAVGSADRIYQSSRGHSRLEREVRHELVMLPYYGVFDNLAFRLDGNTVILSGQVTRPTLKSDAAAVVRDIEGVERVVNNIDVLPLSPNDDRIRLMEYRAIYGQTVLNRYALQAVPPIHIIVSNGNVTLEGVVAGEGDRNLANIQARSVPGVFSVTNHLRVE
jgi:hyperosmotically inducible protein